MKERERCLTVLCVYVCVFGEHSSELVKERQRERAKKDQLDFQKRERQRKKKTKKVSTRFLNVMNF